MRKRVFHMFSGVLALTMLVGTLAGTGLKARAEEDERQEYQQGEVMTEERYQRLSKGKKGIAMNGAVYTENSVEELGVSQMYFNIQLTDVISTNGTGVPYNYNGKTYYFKNTAPNGFYYLALRIKELTQKNITVTTEILMPWTDDPKLQQLIYPTAREPGHQYYALNATDSEARETLAATFHYLAEFFGKQDCFVSNWILGNEINSPEEWNYSGNNSNVKFNVTLYKQAFDLLYNAIQAKSPQSKAFICLDNNWTYNSEGASMSAKDYLDEFARQAGSQKWNLAHHPYAVPYSVSDDPKECVMWSPWSVLHNKLTYTQDSLFVCGANIEVLTDYVKNNFGPEHRIILSEWSMDANAGEDAQTAGMLYTYYAAERNDMIDACIYQPWVDFSGDFRKMGLLSSDHRKREAYDIFRAMDTPQAEVYTRKYRDYLGISSWSDKILYDTSKSYWSGLKYYVNGEPQSNVFYAPTRENPAVQWYYFAYSTDDASAGTKAYEIRTGWLRDEKTGKLHFAFLENGLLMANMWSSDHKYYFDGLDLAIGKFVADDGYTYFSYSENATINGEKVTGIVQSGWVMDENTGDLYFCFPENQRMARGIQLGRYIFDDSGKCLNP